MRSLTIKGDYPCPVEQSPEDGTLLIRGTNIKASYILEQLATEYTPTELMAKHPEITVDAISFILSIASLILEHEPIELEQVYIH